APDLSRRAWLQILQLRRACNGLTRCVIKSEVYDLQLCNIHAARDSSTPPA
ncbi:hypothetical protein L195_g062014, partial [Trifolium pratense]